MICVFFAEYAFVRKYAQKRGETMLLKEEQYLIKWLSQYGALPKAQITKMLQKPPQTAERIIKNLKKQMRAADVSGGYYVGLDSLCRPDQRTILAVWVLLKFIDYVDPMAHYPAVYPSQIFFLKENVGYEIVVLYEGEQSLLRLLQPQDDLKYIIVLPRISMAEKLKLPKVPCLFATVDFQGNEEPEVTFYSEEAVYGTEQFLSKRVRQGGKEGGEAVGPDPSGEGFLSGAPDADGI